MKSYNVDDSIWARIESWEPYITLRLIAINVLVFLATTAAQHPPERTPIFDRFALSYYSAVVLREHYRMLSAMFLHEGWMHIFNNMLFLALLGYMVEKPLGRAKFLLAYVGAGYFAFLFTLVWQYGACFNDPPDLAWLELQRQTLGASGAVMGLLGVWFAYERSLRVSFSQMWHSPSGQRVAVLTGYYLISNLAGRDPTVSYAAHIGGILGGFLLGYFLVSRRYRGETMPRQGWLALAAFLALLVGHLVYLYSHIPSGLTT